MKETPLKGCNQPSERLMKIQTTSRLDHIWSKQKKSFVLKSQEKDIGEYETLSSVNLGRKKYKLRMLFCSANVGCTQKMRGVYTQVKYGYWETEGHEWFRQFWKYVYHRRLPLEIESMRKGSFTPSNVDSRRKGSSEIFSRGTQNNHKESPVCCIDGHPLIQKYKHSPWESSKEQYCFFTWEILLGLMNLHRSKDFFLKNSRTDEKIVIEKLMSRGRSVISLPKSSWERSTKREKSSIFTKKIAKKNSKLSPSTSTIIEYSGLFPDEFLQFVDGELRFKNIAQEGRELRQYVHRIFQAYRGKSRVRFTRFEQRLKRRWIFKHGSGNRCPHKAGRSRLPRKQRRQRQQQHQQCFIKASENEDHYFKNEFFSRGQNLGLPLLDDRRAEDTPLILSSSTTYDSSPWWIQEEGCTHTLFTRRILGGVIRFG